ncbi:MAG: hypothetical protein BGN86_04465 [Caulobacterales bacterium 68-7]|nr:hypothetical protein [Caulobacterales bacterium]OJU08276.1 MAG: hypothetical protein BGN86_04465 [Caulobacterales bacterium 68-7]
MNPGLGASLAESRAVHIAFAFLAMGGWAAFANRGHGLGGAAIAGLVQGALSALITLVLQAALTRMFGRLNGLKALVIPPTVTCIVVLLVLLTAHRLAGTREVLATIALPYAVSSLYAWIFTARLHRRALASETPS